MLSDLDRKDVLFRFVLFPTPIWKGFPAIVSLNMDLVSAHPISVFTAVYVCVLYRSMGTGLLRMNIHTLCTLSCTAHTVDLVFLPNNVSFLSVKILLHVHNCYIQINIKE